MEKMKDEENEGGRWRERWVREKGCKMRGWRTEWAKVDHNIPCIGGT